VPGSTRDGPDEFGGRLRGNPILDKRLAGARTIVFAGGFSDLSYFNKSFRKLYRQTPSDVRTTASDWDNRR
jgi:AraC-like DNA-binding protein